MIFDMAARIVNILRDHGYYPLIEEIDGFSGNEVIIDKKSYLNFASNDYLGFTRHLKIIEVASNATREFGLGSGGSRLTSGTQKLHRQLEEKIAVFKRKEDAVIFSAGYIANTGIIPALTASSLKALVLALEPSANSLFSSCEIFLDELVHASIIDGLMIATSRIFGGKTRFRFYNHLDVDHLESFLKHSDAEKKLVITDGIFSLHGRIAPLKKMVEIIKEHKAELYVDDAHATGVLGKNGRGTPEFWDVEDNINYCVGTLSKALGASGGFIAGNHDLCDYLRVACRTHIFQTSMPPGIAAGLMVAFDLIEEEPERRRDLLKNAAHVNKELIRIGFDTFGSMTQIIPVRFWTTEKAKKATKILFREGIFAPCYYYPAVRHDEDMVRINLMATHTTEQIEKLLIALEKAGKETNVI